MAGPIPVSADAVFPTQAIERILSRPSPEAQRRCLMSILDGLDATKVGLLAEALKDRTVSSLWSDIAQAQQISRLLLSLARRTRSEEHRALALRVKAQVMCIGLGEHRRSLRYYRQALAIHRAHDDCYGQALVYLTHIWALGNSGQYKRAVAAGEWAAEVFREREDWAMYTRLQNNMATIHNHAWQLEQALACMDAAVNGFEQMGEIGRPSLANGHLNRAYTLSLLGRFKESIGSSQLALDLARDLGQKIVFARAQHNLAITNFLMGQYNQSLNLLIQARDAHQLAGQPQEAALCDLNTVDCLLELNRVEAALEKCGQIMPVFNTLGMQMEAAETAHNQARAYLRLERISEAIAALTVVRQLYDEENVPHWALATLEIAQLTLRMGEPTSALVLVEQCLERLSGFEVNHMVAQAHLVAADALSQLGNSEKALDLLEKGLGDSIQHDWPALVFQGHVLRARFLQADGCLSKALHEFTTAVAVLEKLRSFVMLEFRSGFLESRETVYAEMITICLKLDDPRQALEIAERARSQALIELLSGRADLRLTARHPSDQPLVDTIRKRQGERQQIIHRLGELALDVSSRVDSEILELQRRILILEKEITDVWHRLLIRNEAYAREAALWNVNTPRVEDILPEPGCLLLEYFLLMGEYVLFLVETGPDASKSKVQVFRLTAAPEQIERLLQSLQLNIESVAVSTPEVMARLTGNAQKLLHRLYDQLLAPVAAELARFDRLVIVPHGPLHYIPFHALFDGQHYLIETHTLRYLPAGHLVRLPERGKSRMAGPWQRDMLAVGHSFQGALPGTAFEARAIARLWNRSAGLTFSTSDSSAHKRDCLHGLTAVPAQKVSGPFKNIRAVIRHRPARLVLERSATVGRITRLGAGYRLLHVACHGDFRGDNPLFSGLALEDGWLTTLDIFNLRLSASLVTLSACQTGRSVAGGGDELNGLMRAFLASGAESLVLTQWSVSDQATAGLMESFYREMAAGEHKASALRRAQLEYLDGPHAHPYFWASFYLVGQDGPVFNKAKTLIPGLERENQAKSALIH